MAATIEQLNIAFKEAPSHGWTHELIKDVFSEYGVQWTWAKITDVPDGKSGELRAMLKRHPSWIEAKHRYIAALAWNGVDYKLLRKACVDVGEKPPSQCTNEERKRLFRMVMNLLDLNAVPDNPLRSQLDKLAATPKPCKP